MEPHRGHIGGALLGLTGLCWVSAVPVATAKGSGWTSLSALGLLVAGILCLLVSLWAFGFWRAIWGLASEQRSVREGRHGEPAHWTAENEIERRELRGLAQSLRAELETCRYQLTESKDGRYGWTYDHRLPAERYSEWLGAGITADEIAVNKALEGFYVWADQINRDMHDREAVEVQTVGPPFTLPMLDLSGHDVAKMKEGLSRIRNAQEHLEQLIDHLARKGQARTTLSP